jgi:hypothetical protein
VTERAASAEHSTRTYAARAAVHSKDFSGDRRARTVQAYGAQHRNGSHMRKHHSSRCCICVSSTEYRVDGFDRPRVHQERDMYASCLLFPTTLAPPSSRQLLHHLSRVGPAGNPDEAVGNLQKIISFDTVSDISQPKHVRSSQNFEALWQAMGTAYPDVWRELIVEEVRLSIALEFQSAAL